LKESAMSKGQENRIKHQLEVECFEFWCNGGKIQRPPEKTREELMQEARESMGKNRYQSLKL